jgi:hypothetical protein
MLKFTSDEKPKKKQRETMLEWLWVDSKPAVGLE